MKRTRRSMMRYGEPDFDRDYIKWGFTDPETQIKEADSAIGIAGTGQRMRILDIGCGIGTHAVRWAELGHDVTAIDISPTFIGEARQRAKRAEVEVKFVVGDIPSVAAADEFDLITCIEYFPHESERLNKISKMLKPEGRFLFDVRNPFNEQAKRRGGNSRTWKEENGKYYLERHETVSGADWRVDQWITIDPENEIIDERFMEGKASESKLQLYENAEKLLANGFSSIEYRTIEGEAFENTEEPYWLWCVGRTNEETQRGTADKETVPGGRKR